MPGRPPDAPHPAWMAPFLGGSFERQPGASDADIAAVETRTGVRLPAEHAAVLAVTNGGGGWVGEHYLSLYDADEIAEVHAALHDPLEGELEFLVFASDGAGESFAFDLANGLAIVMVPATGLFREDAIPVADTLPGFVERLLTTESLF